LRLHLALPGLAQPLPAGRPWLGGCSSQQTKVAEQTGPTWGSSFAFGLGQVNRPT
jgi:hypothetical protein